MFVASDSSTFVECPVCSKTFKQKDINTHVNECLNQSTCETSDPIITRKRKVSDDHDGLAWGSLKQTQSEQRNINNSNSNKDGFFKRKRMFKNSKTDLGDKSQSSVITIQSEVKSPKEKEELCARNVIEIVSQSVTSPLLCKSKDGGDRENRSHKMTSGNECHLEDQSKSDLTITQPVDTESSSKKVNNIHPFTQQKASVEKQESKAVSSRFLFGQRTNMKKISSIAPLAEQMRPTSFDEYVGQDQAIGPKSMLRCLLQSGEVPSLILWGPPGCGKTSLAKVIANNCKTEGRYKFTPMSATNSGVNDVKEAVKVAKNDRKMLGRRTIIFLDEIHRFNKTQQDALLPHVEDGTIILIGATTENPSFQVNNALLSRCKVIVLEKLAVAELQCIIERALISMNAKMYECDKDINNDPSVAAWVEKGATQALANLCDGDARSALNTLQMVVQSTISGVKTSGGKVTKITTEQIQEGLQRSHVQYDRSGEEHYNIISALHKSIRGSDENAALYWLARMLEGGETPLYVARRLVRLASEDIGLADPLALNQAVSAYQACHFIGMPECDVILAQCAVYMARAPKSVEVYKAYARAKNCVRNHKGSVPSVPLHLRNAPTGLMKSLGYGKGYKYNPDYDEPVDQEYLPKELRGTSFFTE